VLYLRRWSLRSKAFLLLAIAAGLLAYLLMRDYAAELEALRPVAGDPRTVAVAAGMLARGTVLTEAEIRLDDVPSAFAPPGAFGAVDALVGRTLVSDVAEGEAITRTRVGVEGGPVASVVPDGLRAFPISAGLPDGAVRAGDLVDVIATFGGPRPYADTVASGLEVLAILGEADPAIATASAQGPALVLLVSPEVAEELAYASAFADLAVAVAPPAD
jgi:Flp pilus assembly protein CpaB